MQHINLDQIKKEYQNGDPSHDWSHVTRVVNMCHKLGAELGAEMKYLIPAAYLHDVVNVPKNHPDRHLASQMAADKARSYLEDTTLNDEDIKTITTIILEHSYSANLTPSCIESAILQDADKLDAMGAIGVMRWSTCGALMQAAYYHPQDPWGEKRDLDDRKYSLDHFEKKLLKLYSRLNTEPAKIIGKERMDFFHHFLEQLKSEI
jgi:uncharacterized protein